MAVPVDYRWSSQGGLLLDGTGDIADTSGTMDSVLDMVRSRVKAAIDGWKMYRIGAGLRRALGQANSNELEVVVKRRLISALTNNFLKASDFSVTTLVLGDTMTLYVYVQNALVVSVTASTVSDSLDISVHP